MNQINQRIPAWMDCAEPQSSMFETLDELLLIEWVSRWKNRPNFKQFSIKTGPEEIPYSSSLMAEWDNGEKCMVVGSLKTPQGLSLIEWENPNV